MYRAGRDCCAPSHLRAYTRQVEAILQRQAIEKIHDNVAWKGKHQALLRWAPISFS